MQKIKFLSDLCLDIIDCPHTTPNWKNSGIPVIRNFNLIDGLLDTTNLFFVDEETYKSRIKRGKPESGDLIFSREAPVGSIAMIPYNFKCCLGQRLVLIKSNPVVCNKKYLLYAMQSDFVKKQYSMIESTGSIVSNFNISDLKNLKIPYFPLETQEQIGAFLYSLDEKISLNKKINSTLEEMARTIYDYYFLQFDFPDENGKPYKSSGGAMVFNAELGRDIPATWQIDSIKALVKNYKNGDWGKSEPDKNHTHKVICLRGADFPAVNGNGNLAAPVRYISEKNTDRILESGDIIIEISGGSPTQSTGRTCYINSTILNSFAEDIITSNFCKALTLTSSKNIYFFYLMWTKLYENGIFFNFEGKTTGIKNLLFEVALENIKIPIPQKELIEKFNFQVAKIFEMIQINNQENRRLAELRNFLLPLLMNGQVTIKR